MSNENKFISHTTRKKRPGEVDGVDYYFVSIEMFNSIPMAASFSVSSLVSGGVIGKYGVSEEEFIRVKKFGDKIIGFLGRSASGKTTSEDIVKNKHLILPFISQSYLIDLLKAAKNNGFDIQVLVFEASREIRKERMISRGTSEEDIFRRFLIEDNEGEYNLQEISHKLGIDLDIIDAEASESEVLDQVLKVIS